MSFNGQSNQWQQRSVPFPTQQMFLQQQPQPPAFAYPFAFQQQQQQPPTVAVTTPPPPQGENLNCSGSQAHYNSIGTVTKMNKECGHGLVNDEVFFYRNACKGHALKLGDRVIFEANFSSSGQFKWNATRVQLLPQQQQQLATQPQPLMGGGVMTSKLSGGGGHTVSGSGYNAVPPPGDYQRNQMSRHNSSPPTSRRFSPVRERYARERRVEKDHNYRPREREDDEHDRKRRRDDHSRERLNASSTTVSRNARSDRERDREQRDREREKEISRTHERERMEHQRNSPVAARSIAKSRKSRTIRRYTVQIPKSKLAFKLADVQELRQRYNTLYVPSDFFQCNAKWSETFTCENPFSLHRTCQFHIMHKIVEPPFEQKVDVLEPSDANYTYSAKVMLMACPPVATLYQKCFEDDDNDANGEQHSTATVHPSRLIGFLVGTRGRNEPMAIGGPWSPSLDGNDPEKDPTTLIRTAIRTCKALTGIDLSNCTQWYRFMEIYYYRNDYTGKSKEKTNNSDNNSKQNTTITNPTNQKSTSTATDDAANESRIETVVFYLPDIHSCMPDSSAWEQMMQVYKSAVDQVIARKTTITDTTKTTSTDSGGESNTTVTAARSKATLVKQTDNNASTHDNPLKDNTPTTPKKSADSKDPANITVDTPIDGATAAAVGIDSTPFNDVTDGDNTKNEKMDNNNCKIQPTHYSQLQLKTMKVTDIKNELNARGLLDKGARNIILARLAKVINEEKAADSAKKNIPSAENSNAESVSAEPNDWETETADGKKYDVLDNDAYDDGDDDKEDHKEDYDEMQMDENRNTSEGQGMITEHEEHEDWTDGVIDVDMSDIVILDEYDASKNPDGADETAAREMDEKEKNQLIRRYTLPSTPHVLVHPHKTAKGGKFDCSVMSLSVLLDYRPEDTKERFFEVSLFAELFNEMLMRDFGFNIYKELYKNHNLETNAQIDEQHDSAKKDELLDAGKDDEQTVASNELNENKTNDGKSEKSIREQQRLRDNTEDDNQSSKSVNDRKRKLSNNICSNNSIATVSTVTGERKMFVAKPQLLLSFVYFDTTHCGYIFEKDLEDLFLILDLKLSRGQIRKVLGKLGSRQAFYYRKLTDREDNGEPLLANETMDDDLLTEQLSKIAAGNTKLPTLHDAGHAGNNDTIETPKSTTLEEDLINYKGAVLHVGKLIAQNNRVEKSYWELEKLYNDLRKQNCELQKEHNKSTSKIKDLQLEVRTLARKITDANQEMQSLNRKNRDQMATLSSVYNRVMPYFNRDKEKENKEHRPDDIRADDEKEKSKDKDRDSKDNEKSKKIAEKEKITETKKDDAKK